MSVQVRANFVFTEEEFELLGFHKQGDIIENILKHADWDIEITSVEILSDEPEEF